MRLSDGDRAYALCVEIWPGDVHGTSESPDVDVEVLGYFTCNRELDALRPLLAQLPVDVVRIQIEIGLLKFEHAGNELQPGCHGIARAPIELPCQGGRQHRSAIL